MYLSLKTMWRGVVPTSLNHFFFSGETGLSRTIIKMKTALERTASHEEMYDDRYFRRMEGEMAVSSQGIAASAIEHFSPKNLIDIGCGGGSVLAAFRERGVPGVGLEYSEAALRICQEKGLEVHKFDIESDAAAPIEPADLVLSTEVAEHLPEKRADRYVDLLVRLSRQHIILTAATPGQGGTDHVNEQPNSYWIEKLERRGARHLDELTARLREEWRSRGVDGHRARNVLVFRAAGAG
jgi:cyclopropane fatty-acyl-phospholipid synthase-like methyltransferase